MTIFVTSVEPGKQCKVVLPPCSAIEIKNASLDARCGSTSERCVLECDLATRSFALCSLVPNGPRQAALGTVITNNPNDVAWLFLRARGTCTFHVLGQLIVERRAKRPPLPPAPPPAESELNLDESGWGFGSPVRSSGNGTASRLRAGDGGVYHTGGASSERLVQGMEARKPRRAKVSGDGPVVARQRGSSKQHASHRSPSAALRGGQRSARRRAAARARRQQHAEDEAQ